MSLYFKERSDEQKEDPEYDKIVFTHSWSLRTPAFREDGYFAVKRDIITTYGFDSTEWDIVFFDGDIRVETHHPYRHESTRVWNGTCFISYSLFYDNDMRFLYRKFIYSFFSPVSSILSHGEFKKDFFCSKKRCFFPSF